MALPAWLIGVVPDIIEKGIDIFDRKFQTEAEKQEAIRNHIRETEIRIETAYDREQKEITERHKNDMSSDSWLSKNIRPMVLIYLLFLFTIALFREVPEKSLDLLGTLLLTAFVFYFGSRGLEKITHIVAERKKNR